MLEEEEATQRRREPSVNSHLPASEKTQDICDVLASIFKEFYTDNIIGRDTSTKTKNKKSSYHARYMEELQQAHSEYQQSILEADKLESHIFQARARAAAKEQQAYERMRSEMEDVHDHQGLLIVKSAFSSCVDQDFLKMNSLIAPQDYLTTRKPQMRAPAAVKWDPARPIIAQNIHICREPQAAQTCSPEKTVGKMNKLDHSLTFENSSETSKRKKTPIKPSQSKPKWKDEPSATDRAEGWEKLQKLKDQQGFLRNPRFLPPNTQRGGISLIQPGTKVQEELEGKSAEKKSPSDDHVPVFLAKPSVVIFTDYSIGNVYETTLELKNLTSSSRHIRVIPPTTQYFSIGLGRFPGKSGVVAPGMSCKYTLRFAPDSLSDYKDFIVVETMTEQLFVVPIRAWRPPPVLTLPRVLDCGYCLIGGVKFVEFPCQNVGLSAGTFCVIPKSQWPTSNLRSVSKTYFTEQPPFAVSPSLFVLQPGEALMVEVVFFPTTVEKSCQDFTVVCDNCQVKDISLEGEGQLVALELVSVSGEKELPVVGEVRDLTAEHFVRFSPSNPHSVQQKKIIIRNNVHLDLPFFWQIMKPNLHPLLPGELPEPSHIHFHLTTDGVFHVSPSAGILAPCQDQEFILTFCPKELKDFHSVCHLVLKDVPQLPSEPTDSSVLQPLQTGSKISNVIIMEIEVKGSTEPYRILLEPYAVVIPGEVLIGSTAHRKFKMWNHSRNFILFQWEKMESSSHLMEIYPSAGRIEENECFDFDLIVSGGKPERVVTSLVCHIQHRHEPVTLAVEVSFKGPIVSANVPSVDFGLLRLGEQTQTTLILSNNTEMEASWTLEEILKSQQNQQDSQISMEPSRGVLSPLTSCKVNVVFRPRFCQQFETELELSVKNGTGCHLSIRADVQSPQVCLLSCKLLFSELYIGVPVQGTIKLFNQTLLPADFRWMTQLQGKHSSLCTANFDPSSGTLGPNACMDIIVNFTLYTDLELTDVAALCEVQEMNSPLVLTIVTPKAKTLSVSYSLPGAGSPQDDQSPLIPILDFGIDVILKRAVTKQLMITNQTPIPAPFTIEAEFFSCHASKPDNQSDKKVTYMKNPLHCVQAKKVEEKAQQEFVCSLLAHGKGAAFLVEPHMGTLGPFETQKVEVTAYTDMWGEYSDCLICKVGDLEATYIPMQMTVKGCPLYFQMTGPRTDDQHRGPIIQFGTHISGGDTVSRSLRINNPTLFDIRLDWETYNIEENDSQLVDVVVTYGDAFPLKDADGNEVLRGALRISEDNFDNVWTDVQKLTSKGTSSSLQSTTDAEEFISEEDEEDEEEVCLYPSTQEKVICVHIRPHIGNLSDYPYCITPQQIVIPAKSSGVIHVSFTPLTLSGAAGESRCVGLAQGFMSLDCEMAVCFPGKVKRSQGLDLEPVRMDLLAAVKPAVLLVQMEEDDGVLEFHATASDLLRAESNKEVIAREFNTTQSFQLKNTSEMPLHFRLGSQSPFSVLKPQPRARSSFSSNPPTGDKQSLLLQPQHSMRVKVAFHCSLSLLDHVDETDEDLPPGVSLIHSAGGQKKLKFQQNLLIHYSNNSLQTVPLRAYLDLSTLTLSNDSINFGSCCTGQTQTREVLLICHGAHTYWKSLTNSEDGDSNVFRVTPDFGLLRSKELHSSRCSQCLHISFTPSKDKEFRALVVIQSPLVKKPLTLQLTGAGSLGIV